MGATEDAALDRASTANRGRTASAACRSPSSRSSICAAPPHRRCPSTSSASTTAGTASRRTAPEGPWRLRTYIDPRDRDATRAPSPTPDPRRTDPQLITFSPIRTLPVWESIDRFSPDAMPCARAANPDAPWEAFNASYPHWLQADETPADSRFLCALDSEAPN